MGIGPNGRHPDILDHLSDCDHCNIDISSAYEEYFCWACDKPLKDEEETVHIVCSDYELGGYVICQDCYKSTQTPPNIDVKAEIDKFIETLKKFKKEA